MNPARPHFNRAAGFRRLGARKHAAAIRHTTESAAGIDAVQRTLYDAIHELAAAHKKLTRAENELVQANEILCSAQYEAPPQQEAASA